MQARFGTNELVASVRPPPDELANDLHFLPICD